MTAIAVGTTQSGTLVNPGDQALYTFTGTAGERLDYDALIPSDGSLYALVQTPTGVQLINQNAFSDVGFTLPVAGTYTLVVYGSGAATGNYSFCARGRLRGFHRTAGHHGLRYSEPRLERRLLPVRRQGGPGPRFPGARQR